MKINFNRRVANALVRFYGRLLLKVRGQCRSAVFFTAYIKTFSLFSSNKLKRNLDIATTVTNRIFETPIGDGMPAVDDDQVNALFDSLMLYEKTRKDIANYYLLESFYLSYQRSNIFQEYSDKAFEKAKTYLSSVQPVSKSDVSRIEKEVRFDVKELKKEIRRLNALRIETEKLKSIKPIKITQSHFLFIASLFSTLFLIAGFIYNKILLGYFGINVGDFFSASDYISSSVDVLVSVIVSSAGAIVSFFFGRGSSWTARIHSEQFEISKDKFRHPLIGLIFILVLVVNVIVQWYLTGEFIGFAFYFLVLVGAIVILDRLPFWKYIENQSAVLAAITSVLIFALVLSSKIMEQINAIKSGKVSGQYLMTFNSGYEKYSSYTLIDSNSGYLFLWNPIAEKATIIPRSEVKRFDVR